MKQLPGDYYRNNIPTPAPAVSVSPVESTPGFPTSGTYLPPGIEPPVPPFQSGGVWVGTTPPDNPGYGWLWLNSSNNGLYAYSDPGVWTQIGTNW